MAKLLAGDLKQLAVLREQWRRADVGDRGVHGASFFVDFVVPDDCPRLEGLTLVFSDALLSTPSLRQVDDFMFLTLSITGGRLEWLEGVSAGDGSPSDLEDLSVEYVGLGGTRDWDGVARQLSAGPSEWPPRSHIVRSRAGRRRLAERRARRQAQAAADLAAESSAPAEWGGAGSATATRLLSVWRDGALGLLAKSASGGDVGIELDYSPASLRALEAWYLLERKYAFEDVEMSCEEFQAALAMYFCDTLVHNDPRSDWVAEAGVKAPGGFRVGVARHDETLWMTSYEPLLVPSNWREDSLWRRFGEWVRSHPPSVGMRESTGAPSVAGQTAGRWTGAAASTTHDADKTKSAAVAATSAYPCWDLPAELSLDPLKRTRAQSRSCRRWLEGCVDRRVTSLLQYLQEPPADDDPERHLSSVGQKVAQLLHTDRFSTAAWNGEPALTAEGEALARDMGLLLAQQLLANARGKVRWGIVRRPSPDYYPGQVALFGGRWRADILMDPLKASLQRALWIRMGLEDAGVWGRLYSGLRCQ